jgi:hypothetical protein
MRAVSIGIDAVPAAIGAVAEGNGALLAIRVVAPGIGAVAMGACALAVVAGGIGAVDAATGLVAGSIGELEMPPNGWVAPGARSGAVQPTGGVLNGSTGAAGGGWVISAVTGASNQPSIGAVLPGCG